MPGCSENYQHVTCGGGCKKVTTLVFVLLVVAGGVLIVVGATGGTKCPTKYDGNPCHEVQECLTSTTPCSCPASPGGSSENICTNKTLKKAGVFVGGLVLLAIGGVALLVQCCAACCCVKAPMQPVYGAAPGYVHYQAQPTVAAPYQNMPNVAAQPAYQQPAAYSQPIAYSQQKGQPTAYGSQA